MRPLLQEVVSAHSPETLVDGIRGEPGIVLLRSALFESPQARYSFVAARGLKNRGGKAVTEPCEGGLVRQDGQVVYPIRQGIPILLIAESMAI